MDQERLWPYGLRVLVIDNNSSYLSVMEELLIKCSYRVKTYKNVREAMSFIYGGNTQTVDLIISDVFFPTEDGLLVLQEVTSKFDIPTVIMSSNGDTSIVMKYITNGASDFLIKPVRIEELKNIWQHVFRKQIGKNRKMSDNVQHVDQLSSCPLPTVLAPPPCATRTTGITDEATATLESATRDQIDTTVTDFQDLRKSRLSWTIQLHRQFIAAVDSLGGEKAVPKKILEIMKVKHLTREQVASHLQKYRLRQRKLTQLLHKDDVPSSSNNPNESTILRTQFNSSPGSMYFDQDECMEITEYSLPKDALSSSSNCMLGEGNNYSPGGFQDFRWASDKQGSETTYLWNFEADE
ncbi:hypothetical protein BS78_01G212800 [Paspalum vaginatum]|nr:hypothetical protein BS78_01G212800 [Paspalum vaginatum]